MEAQYFEKETRTENPILKILMVAGIVLIFVTVVYIFFAIANTSKATSYIGNTGTQDTINVSETGTAYSLPADMPARVTLTTTTYDTTISEALRKNTDKTDSVKNFLKNQGIKVEDVKDVDFNIYPTYVLQTKGVDANMYPLGKRVITGYQAVNSVEVLIRKENRDQIGRCIQGSIEVGASQVSGLQFIINDEEADIKKKEAREIAITNAKKRAEEIATKMGVRLGEPIDFTESYSLPIYRSSDAATIGTGSNLQIAVRDNKIQATVNISYEIIK